MLSAPCKTLMSLLLLMSCMTALAITGAGSWQSTIQDSTHSTPLAHPKGKDTRIFGGLKQRWFAQSS
jgi:hypothetical protein